MMAPLAGPTGRSKAERFDARLTEDQKTLLQRAADLKGLSLSDFILNSAHDEALKLIEAHEVIRLSAEASQAFRFALENPPAPSAAVIERFKRARRRLAQ